MKPRLAVPAPSKCLDLSSGRTRLGMNGKRIGSHCDLYKEELSFDIDLERGEKEKEGNTRVREL